MESLEILRESLHKLYPNDWVGEKVYQVKEIEHLLPFQGEKLRILLTGLSSVYESEFSYENRYGLDCIYIQNEMRK